ncbi:RapZ C-terminal domain-containing protein [Streptomyces cinereoruber]|uniref:RapZ C-terminal domain-containing protein n=1 Tax=Streptomyces cinereoruber TaxID=67260 RepID=UPI003C2E566B
MQITRLPGRGLVAAVISSIGIRHEGAHGLVSTGFYLDLSRVLRNPADDPALRYRTGLDGDVYAHVLKTPGALTLISRTVVQLRALADEVPVGRLVRLTVACQGGRHRSVAAAETVDRLVWEAWGGAYGVDVEHHHIDRPVLTSSTLV